MSVTAAQLTAKVSAEGVERTKADLISTGDTVDATHSRFKLFALGVAAVAATALVGIGVQSIRMAGNFQESMTALVTGAGEAESNLKLVSDGILKMAVDTGTSTKQLSDGMYMIESSGQHGKQALDTLKAAAEGARVGSASLADVANGVTTAMTDYASTGLTAAQATNTLIATVAAGKTHMGDLANAMSTILPTASAVGVSLGDTSAAMATMTGEGTDAASAATYLRQLLMALENPASKGAAALESIGLSSADVANEMKVSLPGALEMITDHLKTKFPEGSQAYIAALADIAGGSRQMQGMLELTGTHLDIFKNNVTGITDAVTKGGDSIAGWSKVQGDFNFKLSQAKEVFETTGIALGTKLLPIAGAALGVFVNMVQGITHFAGEVSSAFSHLGEASNPVGQTFANVARIAGETGKQFNYLFGTIESIGINILNQLKQSFGGVGTSIESGFLKELGKVGGVIGQVGDYVHEFASKLGSINFSGAVAGVQQFIGSLSSQFGPIIQNIVSLLGGQFSVTLKDVGKDVLQLGGWFTSSVVPAVQKVVPPFLDLAKTLLGTLVPAAIQIRGVLMDLVQHAFEKFAPIIERIVPPLIQFGGVMAGVVSNAIKFLTPYILSAAKEIGKFADGLIDRLAPIAINVFGMISTAVVGFSKFWSAIWPTVSAVLKGVWDVIGGIIQVAWSLVSGIINVGLDILSGNWSQAWKDIQTMLSGVWNGILSFLGGVWEIIKGIFSPVIGFFAGLFQGAYQGVIGAFEGMAGFFQSLATGIQNAFSSMGDFFTGIGTGMWNGIKGGINAIIGGINDFIGFIDGIHIDIPHVDVGPVHIGGGSISMPQIGKIPLLAEGGIIGVGGMAIVGERGPEEVYLPAGAQVVSNNQLSQAGGSQPTIIIQTPIYLDGRLLANGLMPHITNGIRYATGARI